MEAVRSYGSLGSSLRMERPTETIGPLKTSGAGVGVAVLDSGVYPHPDLDDRLVASVTFYKDTRPDRDELGHGTATAGVIAANGNSSNGQITGVAPGANLINLKVLTPENGDDPVQGYSSMLSALDWTIANKDKFNIKVLNISGGFSPIRQNDANGQFSAYIDPFGTAIQKVVDAGIVVVAAAGNDGPKPNSIIRTPNHNPAVITVGALDSQGTPEDPSDDTVAAFSSRGPALGGALKPDLVASGVGILTTLAPHSVMSQENEEKAARLKSYQSLEGPDLLAQLQQDTSQKKLSSKILAPAVAHLKALLPPELAGKVPTGSPEAESKGALMLTQALVARGVIDTESQGFEEALSEVRHALDQGLSPRPTRGFTEDGRPAYIALDGTSFATPVVSGVIAHMFEVNPNLSPSQVKDILTETANPISDRDPNAVGAGALNAQAAIARAAEYS